MKKIISLLTVIMLTLAFTACGTKTSNSSSASQQTPAAAPTAGESKAPQPAETVSGTFGETEGAAENKGKTLVVYFSWSSNTETMANTIIERTGGDLFEIIPQNAYPEDYTECTEVALAERDANARPAIKDLPESIEGYDTVLIGYPIWWHTAPMIIGTFLENYDLTGVEVYPFTQSASMDVEQFENSMDFVSECAKNANVHDGLFVRASDTDGIISYLESNGLTE